MFGKAVRACGVRADLLCPRCCLAACETVEGEDARQQVWCSQNASHAWMNCSGAGEPGMSAMLHNHKLTCTHKPPARGSCMRYEMDLPPPDQTVQAGLEDFKEQTQLLPTTKHAFLRPDIISNPGPRGQSLPSNSPDEHTLSPPLAISNIPAALQELRDPRSAPAHSGTHQSAGPSASSSCCPNLACPQTAGFSPSVGCNGMSWSISDSR